jgi:hypothetical protein
LPKKAGRSNATKLRLVPLLFGLLALSSPPVHSQTPLTFDDLSESASGTWLGGVYHGLGWINCNIFNAILYTNVWGAYGEYYGMVSASNVVGNGNGAPAEVYATGTNFDFLSVYLTGAFNSNLNVRVEGFRDTNLVYDETKVVNATYATLCTFNYLDIDRLVLSSSGGQPAFGTISAGQYYFVMDDFMFEYVPEPSSLLLTALAAVSLVAVLRRKRR